ncbi:MAG: hypothetical protein JNL38_28580 [Myxococcales bacterium]|jgi:hypothetical protein|nr:hypothetical protein [Myxococcales bacterium]
MALGVGCQALLTTSQTQCSSDADCVARGGAGFVCRESVCRLAAPAVDGSASTDSGADAKGEPWACLANPPGTPAEDRSVSLVYRNRYLVYSADDCLHNRPVAGMEMKLCSQRDVNCASPAEVKVTDCDGYVNFVNVYRGFQGYILGVPPKPTGGSAAWPAATEQCFKDLAAKEKANGTSGKRCAIQASDAGGVVVPLPDDLLPTIQMIVPPPAVGDDPAAVFVEAEVPHLLSAQTLKDLLFVIGRSYEPTAGHFIGQVTDCNGDAAPGAAISVVGGTGPKGTLYYTDSQGLPNPNQGETALRGEAGYVNLDPGPTGIATISVTATRRATNERIGVYAAQIRSGYVTILGMPPLKN